MCLAELSRHGSSQSDEVAVLQNAIASLDREKDALQDAVDQKTESMVLLQEQLHSKVAKISQSCSQGTFCVWISKTAIGSPKNVVVAFFFASSNSKTVLKERTTYLNYTYLQPTCLKKSGLAVFGHVF